MLLNKLKKAGIYNPRHFSQPYDIHYLNKACNIFQKCRYLEIGTAFGGSIASIIDTIVRKNGSIDSIDYFGALIETPGNVGPDLQGKKNVICLHVK